MNQWINCSDKMPADGQKVLAYTGMLFLPVISVIYEPANGYLPFNYNGGRLMACNVTHWQPLPGPPSE